jgi:hypothetical protein
MSLRKLLSLPAIALCILGAAAPTSAAAPPRHLLVIGDSLAYENRPYLAHRLRNWQIESDFSFGRSASDTAHDLWVLSKKAPLPPVIHVSAGTGDDPEHPERLARAVRRVMRIAGGHRCVVWANIWRLRLEEPTFDTLNFALAAEDAVRPNLRVIDWHAMVEANRDWLVDLVHVNAEGNRVRAATVAREVGRCRTYLETTRRTHGATMQRAPLRGGP